MYDLPNKLQRCVKLELRQREVVKWYCQPVAAQRMLLAFGIWIFMVPWTGISSYGVYRFIQNENFELFPFLFTLIFPAVGVIAMLSPLYEWVKAKRTVYVVTNFRLFTIHYLINIEVLNIDLEKVSNIEKRIRSNGSGDLILYKGYYLDSDNDKQQKEYGFFSTPNVKVAEKHVIRLLEKFRYSNASSDSNTYDLSNIGPSSVSSTPSLDIDKKLERLYSKLQKASGSSKYVVQVKTKDLLDKKQQEGLEYSSQDLLFLRDYQTNQKNLNFGIFENPEVIGVIVVIAVVLSILL